MQIAPGGEPVVAVWRCVVCVCAVHAPVCGIPCADGGLCHLPVAPDWVAACNSGRSSVAAADGGL